MSDFFVRNAGRIMAILSVVIVALVAVTVYIIVQEEQINDKIGPEVRVVGPCRTFGINHPECKRQSRLIFQSCITHDLHPACTLAKLALRENEGGDGQQNGTPPSQQPGPPPGGPPNNPPNPPGNPGPNPPRNPPTPRDPVDELFDEACELTNSVDLPVC